MDVMPAQRALVLRLHLGGLAGGRSRLLVRGRHGGDLLPHLGDCALQVALGLGQAGGLDAHGSQLFAARVQRGVIAIQRTTGLDQCSAGLLVLGRQGVFGLLCSARVAFASLSDRACCFHFSRQLLYVGPRGLTGLAVFFGAPCGTNSAGLQVFVGFLAAVRSARLIPVRPWPPVPLVKISAWRHWPG